GEIGDRAAGPDSVTAEIVRISLRAMQCHVIGGAVVDQLHHVDFTRLGPADAGYIRAQCPERRPDALSGGKLDSCRDGAVHHVDFASSDYAARCVPVWCLLSFDDWMALPVVARGVGGVV